LLQRQFTIQAEKTALSVFFEIVQQLYDSFRIHEEIHFNFKKHGDDYLIDLRFPQLYNLYSSEFRRINLAAPADRDSLQTELAAFSGYGDWESFKQQVRFLKEDHVESSDNTIPVRNSCRVIYSKLQTKYSLQLEGREISKK